MVFKFNEYSLDLGELQVDEAKFKMTNDTSYVEKFYKMYKTKKHYREYLLPAKIQCLLNIKEQTKGGYKTYLDLLAGLGISGKIFDVGDSIYNDFALDCVEVLNKNFNSYLVWREDMFNFPYNKHYAFDNDFIFADFNNYTLKKYVTLYKPVVDAMFENAERYVLINDCSKFYLKYGKASYDAYSKLLGSQLNGTLIDFYMKLKGYYKTQYPEWTLISVHSMKDTSFLLFEKGDHIPLSIEPVITSDKLAVKTSLE